jgi:SPOR domain
MRGIIVVSWILAACATAACSRRESAWQDAERKDTIAAYQEYLETFPGDGHAEDARAALLRLREAEAWALAERLRTPEAWQRYLGEWPDGQFAAAARQRLVEFIPPGVPSAEGDYVVQLGAYSTEAAARTDLARLASQHSADLADAEVRIVVPYDVAGSLWKLRTGALPEASARELCADLRAHGVNCVPLPDDSAGQPPP